MSLGVAINGCASAGKASGSADDQGTRPSASSSESSGGQRRSAVRSRRPRRPTENRHTREASRQLGLALLKTTPEEQEPYFKEALKHALASIEAEPENARGWFLAGQAYAKLRDYAGADSTLTQAVKLHRGYSSEADTEREEIWIAAYNDAITAYQANDVPGAIANLEKANLIYRKRPEAFYLIGSFYANQSEYEKAVEAYQVVLQIVRDEQLQPSEDEAKKQWKEIEDEVVANLGSFLLSLDRAAEAEQIYREYLQSHPDHLTTEVNLAIALTRQEKIAEAAEVFKKISSRSDLSDTQLLTVGIGLFNAEDYKGAADAFRNAAEKNPYSRDAHLNYAKAILRQSLVLEEAKIKGTADQDDARLAELYREMIAAGAKTLELDPFNGEILTYIMRSHQGLSQLLPQANERKRHEEQLRATVRKAEALPFEVVHLSFRPSETQVAISGSIKNLKLRADTPIKLRFTILSPQGETLGSEVVTSNAAAAEQQSNFQVVVPVKGEMAGWKYERVQ